MKLEEVQFKLLSEIQSLPSEIALEYVRKSLKEIYRELNWSFLYKRDFLRTPSLINTGTVNVTRYSTDVIVSASLKTILDAITTNDIPIAGRQFRTFGGQIAGSNFIYTIQSYDSANSKLVIDPYYQDQSNSASNFQIFKNLYTAPELIERDLNGNVIFQGIDFAEFEFILAPFAQRKIWLDRNRADIDTRDYNRQSMGDPYWIVSSGLDSSGNQLFEFYPIPTQDRTYQVLYRKEGRDLEPEENIPSSLSYDLILAKAKIKAYEWLMVNGEKVGAKKSPNVFMNLIAIISNPNMENSYSKLLEKARMKDESLYPQSLIDMGDAYLYYQDVVVETVLMDF